MSQPKNIKILFCSSEVVPFAKTGGLADVSGALPQALEGLGHQVKVALPKYRGITARQNPAKIGKAIDVYLIENDKYFNRPELYAEQGVDYPDNLERFGFFCQRTLALLKEINFKPDIIHCNDWQTGLIPVYLKTTLKNDPFFARTKTVFTIHNLAYQGLFAKDKFSQTKLPEEFFNMHALEFYGQVNLLKGALVFSDFITTVSPSYAREIQGWRFGYGLDGILRERSKELSGIINGIDYQLWGPQKDNNIFKTYSKQSLVGKYINKEELQRQLKLACQPDIALIGLVGRLSAQKGIDLIILAMEKLAKLNLQFVLLATGDKIYHQQLEKIKERAYKNISLNLRFDAQLAHKIYAASDMFLMPSNYEPCGLGQLISFRYGTVPIVRKTGGLADTVIPYSAHREAGNGFVFEKYSPEAMLDAISQAVKFFQNKAKWQKLILKIMDYDFSWEESAKKYIQLYQRLLDER